MSSLGEMAGGIAHEINTPLSTIQMKAELLLERLSEGGGNEKVINDSLNSIIITVKKIAKIIRGLRSFSRDGTKDPMSVCAVSQIVNDTFDLCRQKFFDHDVDLKFNFNEDLNILCRPGEISQVLLNLIQNAFDAVENLDQKWIRVDLLEDKKSVLIKVIDSGSGIVKDVQDKLMQPFFTTKAIGKGTGLGLSISRGLIMAHGGTIELETDAVNTTFCLKLPKIKTL